MGPTVSEVPPRTKKLDRKYLDHLAGILRPKVEKEFGGNGTAFANHVGISQPQMAQLLRTDGGDRGVGIVVLMQLRKHLHMSIDDMLGLPPIAPQPVPKGELVAAVIEALDQRDKEKRAAEEEERTAKERRPPPARPSAPAAKRKKPD
jgi:hypothetical protein